MWPHSINGYWRKGPWIISEDLKAEKNVATNVKKADKILGMISMNDKDILINEQIYAAAAYKTIYNTSSRVYSVAQQA